MRRFNPHLLQWILKLLAKPVRKSKTNREPEEFSKGLTFLDKKALLLNVLQESSCPTTWSTSSPPSTFGATIRIESIPG